MNYILGYLVGFVLLIIVVFSFFVFVFCCFFLLFYFVVFVRCLIPNVAWDLGVLILECHFGFFSNVYLGTVNMKEISI